MMDLDYGAIAKDIFGVLGFAAVVDLISAWLGWRISWQGTAVVCTLILFAFDAQRGRTVRISHAEKIDELEEEIAELRRRSRPTT